MRLPLRLSSFAAVVVLLAGLLTTLTAAPVPVSAQTAYDVRLTVNGDPDGPVVISPPQQVEYTVTGLPVIGRDGITVVGAGLVASYILEDGTTVPAGMIPFDDTSSGTASGSFTVPGLAQLPSYRLSLQAQAGYQVGEEATPRTVLSNAIELTLPPPPPFSFTTTLAVEGDSVGPVGITLGVPFDYTIGGVPTQTPPGVFIVGSILYLTPDPATPLPTTGTPPGVYPIAITPSGTSGQATIPAEAQAALDPTLTYYLVAATLYARLTTGTPPTPSTVTSNGVPVSLTVNTAPTISGLTPSLRVTEDTPASTTFTVGDAETAPADLTVTAAGASRGTVTLSGSGAGRTLTYTPNDDVNGPDTFTVTVSDGQRTTDQTVGVVIDPVNDAPVIDEDTVPAPSPGEATGSTGTAVDFTPPTASDPDGTTPAVRCDPAPGTTFPLGDTAVTCTASDDGTPPLTDTVTFTVTVVDTTTPAFPDLPGDPTDVGGEPVSVLTAEATGPTTTVSWPALTATDTVSGSLTATCDPPAGTDFPVGATTVTCSATDGAGLTGTGTFLVRVVDTTAPTITLSGGVQDGRTYARRNLPPAPTCSAIDAVDGPVPCTVAGYQTGFGTHTITATATDAAGNPATVTVTYTVADRAVGPTATPRPPQPTATPRPTERPRANPTATPAPSEPTVRPTPRARTDPTAPAPTAPAPTAPAPTVTLTP